MNDRNFIAGDEIIVLLNHTYDIIDCFFGKSGTEYNTLEQAELDVENQGSEINVKLVSSGGAVKVSNITRYNGIIVIP